MFLGIFLSKNIKNQFIIKVTIKLYDRTSEDNCTKEHFLMTYEVHLDKPLPEFVKNTLKILKVEESEGENYIYQIDFRSHLEHEEFCEIVYSILDINGSEEAA